MASSVNSYIVQAYRVEWGYYNGVFSQIAYYNNSYVVTNATGQYAFDNGVCRSYSNNYGTEILNGISYLVFYHTGGKVYSLDYSQFMIIY